MKAARYYGMEDVRFEEIEKPVCKENEVLIKVLYSGICGSDIHIYRKGMFIQNIPETMGHEFIGVIEKTGTGVKGYKEGELVVANPMVPCMECSSCKKGMFNTCEKLGFIGEVKQGCFAEYIVMNEEKLIPVKRCNTKDTNKVKKLVLTEPLAVAVNVMRRAGFTKTDKLVVLGAGPIGCLVIALSKQIYGLAEVTAVDISAERLKYAAKAGADICLMDSSQMQFDYTGAVDCAGVKQTVDAAVSHISANGKLCIVSIFENPTAIDCNTIVEKQLRLIGCNVYIQEDMVTASELLSQEKIDIDFLITHEFPLEECKDAFALLTSGQRAAEKIVFKM